MIWFFDKNRILVPKNLLLLVVLYFGLVVLQSCAHTDTTALDSVERRYLAARTEFNNTLSRYILYKSNAPLEVQAEWEETIEPLFQEGSVILDSLGLAIKLKTMESIESRELEFLDLKNELIDAIAEHKIFE